MGNEQVEELMDRWMRDAAFRAAMRKDPQGAIRMTGIELSKEEWKTVVRIDWSLSDEQLKARVSKGM